MRRARSLLEETGVGRFIQLVVCMLVLFSLMHVFAGESCAAALTQLEERGKQVYETGGSSSGIPIVAYFGKDLLEVPGESATCVSCHGYDGLGRNESGVIPSNITWQQLMKSYGHIHPGGLEHGPFSESSLKSYMEDGNYPGGKQGDPSMPVYQIAAQDLDALIAYLKKLDSHLDPGLSPTDIRIGTLLPSKGLSATLGEVMRQTIVASFNDINNQGGIYGRKLLLAAETVRNARDVPALLRTVVPDQGVFALVNTFTPGLEVELWRLIEEQRVPLIAPNALFPIEDQLLHRYRFYLYAGLRDQALALARYATRNLLLKNPRIQIVYPQRDGLADMLASIEELYHSRGWQNISRHQYVAAAGIPDSTLLTLRKDKPDLVLFLGSENEAAAIFGAFGDPGCTTALYMPGVLLGKGIYKIPASCQGRVWLSFPSLPSDRKEWAMTEFLAMSARQQLAFTHPTAQLAAYAAVKILVEGLRRAGRSLSRERLLEALEGVFEFDTGLTPLVTYTKNRRSGSLGAHVVEVDPLQAGTPGFVVPHGWVSSELPDK